MNLPRGTICIFLFCSMLMAQGITDPPERLFPYLGTEPSAPIAGTSNVTLQVFLGAASNSCMAPTYTGVEATITQSPLDIYPPVYNVAINYTEVVDSGKACPMIYAPVDYGPEFNLGVLRLGQYQVIDNDHVVGTFAVREKGEAKEFSIGGTVVDDPFPMKRMSMPVAKAKLYLMGYSDAPGPLPLAQDAAPTGGIWYPPMSIVDSAESGDDGSYSFAAVPAGSYTLNVYHADFHSRNISLYLERDTSLVIQLLSNQARSFVRGTVIERRSGWGTDLEAPLPGCTVTVFMPIPPPVMYLDAVGTPAVASIAYTVGQYTAVTDKNGQYAIENIQIGENGETWQVNARRAGFSVQSQSVELSNGMSAVADFMLERLYGNSSSSVVDGITYTISTNQTEYKLLEPIRVRYTITNGTRRSVSFTGFSGNCEYDMAVALDTRTEIYRLSDQMTGCLRMLTSVTIEPAQTVTHDFDVYYYGDGTVSSVRPTAPDSPLVITAGLRGKKYPESNVSVRVGVGTGLTATGPMSRFSMESSVVPRVALTAGNRSLSISVPSEQVVNVRLFGLDGRVVRGWSVKAKVPAGTTLVGLPTGIAARVGILQVSGETFTLHVRFGGGFEM